MALSKITNDGVTGIEITSGGLIQPKQVAFQVEALDTDQAIATTATKFQFPTTNLDTASYWDATNHRYTPQVAGWYLFGGVARFLVPTTNQFLRIYVRKNGSTSAGDNAEMQIQMNSDLFSNSALNIPNVMFQLNGSTDYVEVYGMGDEATTFSDATATRSFFFGFLVHAT